MYVCMYVCMHKCMHTHTHGKEEHFTHWFRINIMQRYDQCTLFQRTGHNSPWCYRCLPGACYCYLAAVAWPQSARGLTLKKRPRRGSPFASSNQMKTQRASTNVQQVTNHAWQASRTRRNSEAFCCAYCFIYTLDHGAVYREMRRFRLHLCRRCAACGLVALLS